MQNLPPGSFQPAMLCMAGGGLVLRGPRAQQGGCFAKRRPWLAMGALSESSAWHAPAARDAERPSAGKGGRKGASASKDRRSERFGFTGATKELPTEAAAALANKKRYPFFRVSTLFCIY